MNNQNPTVGLMYFSPTGTTRKICEAIASSMSTAAPIRLDLTKPQTAQPQNLSGIDVLVVGIPVYASRMPAIARERISQALQAIPEKTPAIAVALYGNVDVGAGLKQLVDLLSEKGLTVVGAGEFIGMHYFKQFHGVNPEGTQGRPNEEDLAIAKKLGKAILKRGLDSPAMSAMAEVQGTKVPLKFRFTSEQRVLGLLGTSVVDSSKCTKCGECVKVCPVGCIDPETLMGKAGCGCLGCGNCQRVCPNAARSQSIHMKWMVKRMATPQSPMAESRFYI